MPRSTGLVNGEKTAAVEKTDRLTTGIETELMPDIESLNFDAAAVFVDLKIILTTFQASFMMNPMRN